MTMIKMDINIVYMSNTRILCETTSAVLNNKMIIYNMIKSVYSRFEDLTTLECLCFTPFDDQLAVLYIVSVKG
jgi:hypothetical protein